MKKRNVIAILLTAVIFLAAATLGVTTVYRVNVVTLKTSVISEAAGEEADELQKRLLARYKDGSIFTVKSEAAAEDFAEFPYFRMTSFKKAYPDRLIIEATEDAEVYAVAGEEGYYILGGDGTILGIREDAANRSDGADNVIVTGLSVSGERGGPLVGDVCVSYFLSFCRRTSELINEMRANLVSLEVNKPTSLPEEIYFCLTMREGVRVYVHNPANLTEKKAEGFVSCYLALEDTERLGGRIEVTDDAKNPEGVIATYSAIA